MKRGLMPAVTLVALGVFLLLAIRPAAAQIAPPRNGLDVNTFNIAVGDQVYITQHGAKVPGHLDFGVGMMFNYQANPFAVTDVDPNDNVTGVRTNVVEHLFMGEIFGYLGLFEYVSLGLSMPLGLYQTGNHTDDIGQGTSGFSGFSWGDLGIHIKGRFYGKRYGPAIGMLLTVTAPVGQYADKYVGEKSATFRPRLLVEYNHRYISVGLNLGALIRIKELEFFDGVFRMGQQATYGLGIAVRPSPKINLTILAELYGRTDFSNRVDRNPLEAGAALAYELPKGVHLMLGGNAGIISGIGTPDFRVYLGFRWAPDLKDSDKDGVPDSRDRCPRQKEDRDGFQDLDGCPDLDNDKDGIRDVRDKCPNKAEDFDKFEDTDGCPDPDNDKDGVPDKQDNCPLDKGPASKKGCPENMLDNDGDGVPDARDKCPEQQEDKDGFQDDDGCPDPDNDKDGIPDESDACKNLPEDKDGFQDGDGCPDVDDDSDGVCDNNPVVQGMLDKIKDRCIGKDMCKRAKETINGIRDSDGCPDAGRGAVVFSSKRGQGFVGKFVLRKKLRFTGAYKSGLTAKDKRILDQVAHYLRAFPQLKKVVVMAFTDLRKKAEEAKVITIGQAQEVQRYLVSTGIAKGRVGAVGAGNASPRCKSKRRRCSRKNRRIELFITAIGK